MIVGTAQCTIIVQSKSTLKEANPRMTKNRGYTMAHRIIVLSDAMPKRKSEDVTGFGERLAALRKAAGFTQAELAEEIGVSRRMIAYYEGETEYPPTALLPDLAQALGVSADTLLGLKPLKKARKTDNRLQRRLQQLEQLEPKEKRQVLQLLDTFIERERLRKKAG